jgi:hypothetical protein
MRKILCFTAALLIAGSALAAGEIWRWKDSNGTWHYSDQPQAGAELVRRSGRTMTEGSAPATAPATQAPSMTASDGSQPVSSEVAAQVRREAAAAKTEQCKKAEDAYQKVVQARAVTRTDEAGKQIYLSNAEIDAERLRARSVRDTACGPGA